MINLDLSKGLHPGFWNLLPAFMPGLFFEICILLAEPERVRNIAGRAQVGGYLELFIALTLAFVIGNAFMLLVTAFRFELDRRYRNVTYYWAKILNYLASSKGNPPQRPWLGRFKWVRAAHIKAFNERTARGASLAWRSAAIQLLKRRYGIEEPSSNPDEWETWSSVLGTLKPEDVRGSLLVLTTHATGWSGMTAAYFAPSLRNRYFFLFCGFLILFGVLHTVSVVRRWNSLRIRWIIALKAVLADMPPLQASKEEQGGGTNAQP